MALALYRRYRPRTLADVIGQESVVGVLQNAARQSKIGHAYLFYGPRGSGKTTAARILAKLANCEKRAEDGQFRETGEPCNECRPCMEIDEGRALDVLEIDAASNRGIDEIRSLKEGIRLSPTSHRYKVFIVDEAHQLTKEAFNALLKMLEEPPPHAIFVLATTEFEKIPATIASRTQRLNFKRVPILRIKEKLTQVVKGEQIAVSEDALELIAASADGSFRDAESLLEQVISLGAGMDARSVERLLGKVGFRTTAEVAGFLLRGDLEKTIEALARIDEAGHNLVQLAHDLIHYLRRALVLSFDSKMRSVFDQELTTDELALLAEHAALCAADRHIPLLKSLIEAYSQMRYSPFAIVPLEVAIIESLKRNA